MTAQAAVEFRILGIICEELRTAPTDQTGGTDMISVFTGSDYLQAQLLTGLLQEHGINVFLQGAALQGGLGELPATGHLSIMVEPHDQDAARSLLAAYELGELAIDEEFAEPDGGE
jgi:hypothetical protein